MIRPKFLHLLLLKVFFASTLVQSVCLPNCSGFTGPGYQTPDPYDCTQYYICADANTPSDTPYQCLPGESVDQATGTCTSALPCAPQCGFCHLTCNQGVADVIADPMDCSVYHICLPGGGTLAEPCPSHIPYFNSLTNTCTDVPDDCCVPSCNPYCEVLDGRFVPDPKDCTRYYACTAAPFPVFSCPSGEYFDVVYGICSLTATCVPLCP